MRIYRYLLFFTLVFTHCILTQKIHAADPRSISELLTDLASRNVDRASAAALELADRIGQDPAAHYDLLVQLLTSMLLSRPGDESAEDRAAEAADVLHLLLETVSDPRIRGDLVIVLEQFEDWVEDNYVRAFLRRAIAEGRKVHPSVRSFEQENQLSNHVCLAALLAIRLVPNRRPITR